MNQFAPTLLALFAQNGFAQTDATLLQSVDAFLDLSGEDIRKRLYLTSDTHGAELCLRPEYTIPVAQGYIASQRQGQHAEFCYSGTVFRQRNNEPGEFTQAGVESFGRADIEATDGEILKLGFETSKIMGFKTPKIRIGDVSLIKTVLSALNVPAAQHRKILRSLAANRPVADVFKAQSTQPNGLSQYKGVVAALKGAEPDEARAFVQDLLSIAGIQSVGGRSTADIATRFLAQTDDTMPINEQSRLILDYFLSLEGNPDQVSINLRKMANEAKLDFNAKLDTFDARIGFIAAAGVDVASITCQTRFVRSLDYYSSFIFEVESLVPHKPVIAGGRYDTLLGRLGAANDIPAIGFSCWLDRGVA